MILTYEIKCTEERKKERKKFDGMGPQELDHS